MMILILRLSFIPFGVCMLCHSGARELKGDGFSTTWSRVRVLNSVRVLGKTHLLERAGVLGRARVMGRTGVLVGQGC